jgi:hypothetical protein
MFGRKKPEHGIGAAAAHLERAERDAAEQRAKLAAEMPLRQQLHEIRAQNHLAEELYQVLSARRAEGKG